MRKNGTLSYEIISPGSCRNNKGEPIKADAEWCKPVPCSIKTNSDNRKGKYEDGVFRQASFVILIETQNFPNDIKRLRITRYTENLGEHDIISIEPLLTVGRIQITV